MKVLVIGGGIGGLTMALSLHQMGIPVRVYEAVREVTPLAPAWVWTSTEMLSRSSAVAAASGAAAGASGRVPAQPANIVPTELSSVLHIQSRRVSA